MDFGEKATDIKCHSHHMSKVHTIAADVKYLAKMFLSGFSMIKLLLFAPFHSGFSEKKLPYTAHT